MQFSAIAKAKRGTPDLIIIIIHPPHTNELRRGAVQKKAKRRRNASRRHLILTHQKEDSHTINIIFNYSVDELSAEKIK